MFRLVTAAALALSLGSSALADGPPEPPPFQPPGYAMREFFPLAPAGTVWRYEDGEHWVELTALGPGELDGVLTLRLAAVSDGQPAGVRHFTAEGPLAGLYVSIPGGPGMDFREDPLRFASGARAYVGDRISSAPRSFMGGQVLMTSEVIGTTEVTVPAGTYPQALRIRTIMTHLPSETVVTQYDSHYVRGVGMVWTHGTQGPASFDQKLVEVRPPEAAEVAQKSRDHRARSRSVCGKSFPMHRSGCPASLAVE